MRIQFKKRLGAIVWGELRKGSPLGDQACSFGVGAATYWAKFWRGSDSRCLANGPMSMVEDEVAGARSHQGSQGEEEEGEGDGAPAFPKEEAAKCEQCSEKSAKYKCPGCGKRTCSLPCVKAHKAQDGCSGQRNKAEYHSLGDFTDEHIHSDFHFLMDVERVADNAHRGAYQAKLNVGGGGHKIPGHLKGLVDRARKRYVNLQIMPQSMQKRKQNSTMYNHKEDHLLWRVEWIFHADGGATRADDRLSERIVLSDALGSYIGEAHGTSNALSRQQLARTAALGMAGVRLVMRVEPSRADDVRYHELPVSSTLMEALKNKVMIAISFSVIGIER